MSGTLLHSPEEVIHKVLLDLGLSNLPNDGDWPSFVNSSDQHNVQNIIVSGTTGRLSGKHHVTGTTIQHYGVQVRVRAEQQLSFRRSNEILTALDALKRYTVLLEEPEQSYLVQAVTPSSTIIRVGREQPEDFLFIHSLNFVTSITLLE